ncbi:hypothetical protein T459_09304 [Capsicum annuum]|uniref:Uncharacterized protein n=1 Tax=Capsicum annuum TaxID=4072 RepID=A0A2G2ZZ01_CAPAN|nr:hypothetical protein T459_09304 [Capsicum annuum]
MSRVGTIKKTVPVSDGAPNGEPVESTDREAKPAEAVASESAKPSENGPSESGVAETVDKSDDDIDKKD